MDSELDYLERYINDAQSKYKHRRQLRELNQQDNIKYPEESVVETLDSSIKKNSAFVKKLKTFNDNQRGQILEEIDKLNLTKFTSEAASSIIEARLKLSDIPSVIEICTKLNRSYRDFHKHLLDQYTKYLPVTKKRTNHDSGFSGQHGSIALHGHSPSSHINQSKIPTNRQANQPSESVSPTPNLVKLRVDLRLFAELMIVGILPLRDAFQLLANFLCYIMSLDKSVHQHANAILTFCKGCGDELLGLLPDRIEEIAAKHGRLLPSSDYISSKRQLFLKNCVMEYFKVLSANLIELHKELSHLIAKYQKASRSKGDISKEIKDSLVTRYVEFQKLQNIVLQFSGLLNVSVPDLPKLDDFDSDSVQAAEVQLHTSFTEEDSILHKSGLIWDDDGTRSFYEDIVDLKVLFPDLQIKISLTKYASQDSLNKLKPSNNTRGGASPEASALESPKQEDDESNSSASSPSSDYEDSNISMDKQQQQASVSSFHDRNQPEQFFNKLSNCVNRDMIDNAAIDFIKFFNTKFGRKKLIKTLFNVQRTRLDLLPFFARLTATLYPFVPSIGYDLSAQLKSEFRYLFKKKDQINIESKVKNVRYIGEFVKFGLISKQEAVSCLKMLLSDFTHHHIEMTCNLLETCGRLLYRSLETHNPIHSILQQIMRKKMLLSVDSKYVTMIENAYYVTNPPEVIKQVVDEPPIQMYVRYLLYERLTRSTIDEVLKKLKLLDWTDKSLAKFVINRMIEAYNVKFYNIRYFAALLAALNREHPWISIAVIDGVVEDILLMMEINGVQFNQRRIPMIRYFGELFNYRLSDSSLVFKVLYSIISYEVIYPGPEQDLRLESLSALDPPDNLFRIKLVCDLLDTSGPYLNGSQEKRKLDCYLLFFQRYYWCKRHIFMQHPYCLMKYDNRFPVSTDYLYNDTIFNLRPSFQMANSYSEAIDNLNSFIECLQT